MTIIVEDRNDNAPVFQYLPYNAIIPEVPSWAIPAPRDSRAGELGGSCGMGVPAVRQQRAGNCLTPVLGVW